jgi:hypothetical protein
VTTPRGIPSCGPDIQIIAELRGLLFAHLDGKDYRPALWQQVKPDAGETPHGRSLVDE